MITLRTAAEIALMRKAGAVVREALEVVGGLVKPGVTTAELNAAAHRLIKKRGAIPSFLGYGGYPASICASVDEQVIHGIPGSRALKEGEIISVDIGAILNGWHGDAARTFPVGEVSPEKLRLIQVTEECFHRAVNAFKAGGRLGDIGSAVQRCAEDAGYGVVRKFVGHGIGKSMHEDPQVPNYGESGKGVRLTPGMVLAIEPMINMGTHEVKVLSDGWTVVTLDGKPSAHYENTVALTENGTETLTW